MTVTPELLCANPFNYGLQQNPSLSVSDLMRFIYD